MKTWFVLRMMTDAQLDTGNVQASLDVLTKTVHDDIAARKEGLETQTTQAVCRLLAPVSPKVSHRNSCATWAETPS